MVETALMTGERVMYIGVSNAHASHRGTVADVELNYHGSHSIYVFTCDCGRGLRLRSRDLVRLSDLDAYEAKNLIKF